jgi:hypothetical protein
MQFDSHYSVLDSDINYRPTCQEQAFDLRIDRPKFNVSSLKLFPGLTAFARNRNHIHKEEDQQVPCFPILHKRQSPQFSNSRDFLAADSLQFYEGSSHDNSWHDYGVLGGLDCSSPTY